jgi:hypothetical protein
MPRFRPLATDSSNHAVLRETLRVFLQEGSSAKQLRRADQTTGLAATTVVRDATGFRLLLRLAMMWNAVMTAGINTGDSTISRIPVPERYVDMAHSHFSAGILVPDRLRRLTFADDGPSMRGETYPDAENEATSSTDKPAPDSCCPATKTGGVNTL